jgi:hypothetical protein
MRPVSATPTDARDYALLTAAYAAIAGAVAVTAARRRDDPAPAEPGELVLYGAATAGLSRLLAHEKVAAWARAPFVDEPPEGGRRPRGRHLRYVAGELLSCTRCLGAWSALGLVALRVAAPRPARVVATLLALSAANTLLQAVIARGQAAARNEEHAAEAFAGNGQPAPAESWREGARRGA